MGRIGDQRFVAVAGGGGRALKGQVMINNKSSGPWANPAITDGIYAATVERIEIAEYGDDDNTVIRMTLRLDEGEQFYSNLYVPTNFSPKVQQRFRFLCMALEAEEHEVMEWPSRMTGRKLALDIRTMQSVVANRGIRYSDVHRFLPCGVVEEQTRRIPNDEEALQV